MSATAVPVIRNRKLKDEIRQATRILLDKGFSRDEAIDKVSEMIMHTVVVGRLRFEGTRGQCRETNALIQRYCFARGISSLPLLEGSSLFRQAYVIEMRGTTLQLDGVFTYFDQLLAAYNTYSF